MTATNSQNAPETENVSARMTPKALFDAVEEALADLKKTHVFTRNTSPSNYPEPIHLLSVKLGGLNNEVTIVTARQNEGELDVQVVRSDRHTSNRSLGGWPAVGDEIAGVVRKVREAIALPPVV